MNRLGISVPVAGEPLSALPTAIAEVAAAGYTDAWSSETSATDAFASLSVVALQAPQLRVGTAIASVFTRSPTLMAMNALAVAELSPEPIYLGIGASSATIVEQWHGIPFVKPYQRVRDTLRFLKRAFEGDRVTFTSESFDVDGFRLERTLPHRPRLLVAALREQMLTLAGAESDGVVLNWLSASDLEQVLPFVLDTNPDADVVARIFVVVGASQDEARTLARRHIAAYLNAGVYAEYQQWLGRGPQLEQMWAAWRSGDRRGALAAIPDSVIDDLCLTGTIADIRAGVDAYVKAGVTIPVLAVLGSSQDLIRATTLDIARAR